MHHLKAIHREMDEEFTKIANKQGNIFFNFICNLFSFVDFFNFFCNLVIGKR